MKKLLITGGNRLHGSIAVSGAKNAALPIIASALLADGCSVYANVPKLRDITTIARLLAEFGVEVLHSGGNGTVRVDASQLHACNAPYELVKTMRASILVLGPLLARMGKAKVSLPGGCAIGPRPVDLHLKALSAMGARISLDRGYIVAECRKLKGAKIYFDISTVTGTENVMMAAALAEGTTVLENAAREPEVEELASVLKKMGGLIDGAGTDVITIEGVPALHQVEHTIMPDRIEAGTYMMAAGITRGDITLINCNPVHCHAVIEKLKEIGLEITLDEKSVRVRWMQPLSGADVRTLPYPGFPTDLQAQIMALLCLAEGTSIISETIFEDRFMHVGELRRMGARIRLDGNSAFVTGINKLSGAPVMATDLRASASLLLAALVADGTTEISRIYHLERGYESVEKKLTALGADIRTVST
jgi:UDP-N-acetylglucosamine 1-carboxyvinyltransferase